MKEGKKLLDGFFANHSLCTLISALSPHRAAHKTHSGLHSLDQQIELVHIEAPNLEIIQAALINL